MANLRVPFEHRAEVLRLIENQTRLNRGIAKRNAHYAMQRAASVQAREMMAVAASQASGQVAADLMAMLTGLESQFGRNRRARIRRLYQEVGEAAQQATVDAYKASHSRKPPYRVGGRSPRQSGGKLGRALASPNFFRAGADGLDFINAAHLDSQAKQWYRMNFGAAPRAQSPGIQNPTMKFMGQSTPGLSLERYKPSKKFKLPLGTFSTEFGNGPPSSKSKVPFGRSRKHAYYVFAPDFFEDYTRGIRGKRFLEEGVKEINRLFPAATEKLMLEWLEEAAFGTFKKSGERRSVSSGPFSYQFSQSQAKSMLDRVRPQVASAARTGFFSAPRFRSRI